MDMDADINVAWDETQMDIFYFKNTQLIYVKTYGKYVT